MSTGGSGIEGRIKAEFRSLKKRWDYRNSGLPTLWLFLARKHKRPVQEIKRICGKGIVTKDQ